MPKFLDIIKQPEGRRLEFKAELPSGTELAKTMIAFANDAEGSAVLFMISAHLSFCRRSCL